MKFWSMGIPGRDPVILLWVWWVSLALSRFGNLRHSPCRFLYNHPCLSANDTVTSSVILPVMAGDCGDKIPSKSKPQSAGVTSCTNFESVLHVRYLQTSSFRFYCIFSKFRECSRNSSSLLVFFNLWTQYHLSSPVLTIFAATSFSS